MTNRDDVPLYSCGERRTMLCMAVCKSHQEYTCVVASKRTDTEQYDLSKWKCLNCMEYQSFVVDIHALIRKVGKYHKKSFSY